MKVEVILNREDLQKLRSFVNENGEHIEDSDGYIIVNWGEKIIYVGVTCILIGYNDRLHTIKLSEFLISYILNPEFVHIKFSIVLIGEPYAEDSFLALTSAQFTIFKEQQKETKKLSPCIEIDSMSPSKGDINYV